NAELRAQTLFKLRIRHSQIVQSTPKRLNKQRDFSPTHGLAVDRLETARLWQVCEDQCRGLPRFKDRLAYLKRRRGQALSVPNVRRQLGNKYAQALYNLEQLDLAICGGTDFEETD